MVFSNNQICESKISFLRNDTVGTTGILTPVEINTNVFESKDLKISVVIEAGNSFKSSSPNFKIRIWVRVPFMPRGVDSSIGRA